MPILNRVVEAGSHENGGSAEVCRLPDSGRGRGARRAWFSKPVSHRAAPEQLPELRLAEDARIINQGKQTAEATESQPGGAAPKPLGSRLLRIAAARQHDQEVDVG